MKILLLRPNSIIIATPIPLGLGYLAGAVLAKRKDQIEIVDARNLRWPISKMRRKIQEFAPDVVGISSINFEMREAHQLAEAAREEAPNATVVMGGPYASANREAILEDPNVDVVVVGEGEATFVELLEALESRADLSPVKGIIFRRGEEKVFTGQRELIQDLDSLEPAWELIKPRSYYRRLGRNSENTIKTDHRTVMVFTSRGCPYGCIYCHNVFGKTFRPRSPEAVVAEFKMLHERYDVREFDIVDDGFNLSIPRAKKICEGVIEEGIKAHYAVPNGLRGDRTDGEFLDLMKTAGFYRVAFAIESASPRIQDLIRKNIDLNKVRWSIEEVARRGMFATGYFIQGFPTETYEEMLMTADWAQNSDLHVASFFYLNPFPGTEVAKMLGEDFRSVNFRDYSTISVNVSAATDEELHRANKIAYRKFYLSPRRIARIARVMPKNFRTVVNAFLVFQLLFLDSVNQ